MSKTSYITVLVLAACVTFAVKQRSQGLFGCPANVYDSENFIAYCNQERYGDFDRGAFWFPLEPAAAAAASEADILFLGNSRMQFGLSSGATDEWQEQAVAGAQCINSLPVPRNCIVLTIVPNAETRRGEAQWIADRLDLPLLAPMPAGLRTFDGSHLDGPSAEIWSREFLQLAGPQLNECAVRSTAEASVPRTHRSRRPGA